MTTAQVTSFAKDAGGRGRSAQKEARSVPLPPSAMAYTRALMGGGVDPADRLVN